MHRLLLDVSSLTYRAFFAMPGSVTAPDGRPVNAVHGYLDMVTRLVATRRPGEVVHVYDHDWRPVARTDIYPGYKAKRPAEPEAITQQFQLLRSVLDLTGLLQAETEGWEAEDAIGAFCVEADETDRIEIVSGEGHEFTYRVLPSADGSFSVDVPAGTYVVTGRSPLY